MDDSECIICLEELNTKDVAVLSCKHLVHLQCIQNWINVKNNMSEICPLCNNRGEIVNIIEAQPQALPLPKPQHQINKNNQINTNEEGNVKLPFMCCNIL